MAPMAEVIKGTSFKWIDKTQLAFKDIKPKLTQALVFALPYYDKVFKLNAMHLVLVLMEF